MNCETQMIDSLQKIKTKLCKENFKQYRIVQYQKQVTTPDNMPSKEVSTQSKGGKNKGIQTFHDSIQLVKEMLVNSRKIISLTTVFQKISKVKP